MCVCVHAQEAVSPVGARAGVQLGVGHAHRMSVRLPWSAATAEWMCIAETTLRMKESKKDCMIRTSTKPFAKGRLEVALRATVTMTPSSRNKKLKVSEAEVA